MKPVLEKSQPVLKLRSGSPQSPVHLVPKKMLPEINRNMPGHLWENLPQVVLAKIFSNLQLFDKIKLKYVCNAWYVALSRPEIWRSFIYSDEYVWNELISHELSSVNMNTFNQIKEDLIECIQLYGRHFQHVYIYFKGNASYDLFKEISESCHFVEYIGLTRHETSEAPTDFTMIINKFFQESSCLKEVYVEGIKMQSKTRNEPLPIGFRQSQNLGRLTLKNSFHSCSLSSLMYLVNLQELTINPQSLYHSLINHLAANNLKKLNIVANGQTKEFYFENLSDLQWKDISYQRPLRVHCYLGVAYDWAQKDTLLKPNVPMATLVYRKCMCLQYDHLCLLLGNYSKTLKVFVDYSAHQGSYQSLLKSSISDRQDKYIIKLVTDCFLLQTLAVKEVLSSSTILLLAFINRNLRNLLIRSDMVVYSFDIPEDITLSRETLDFILNNWEEHKFIKAMQGLLHNDWKMLHKTDYISFLQSKYASYI